MRGRWGRRRWPTGWRSGQPDREFLRAFRYWAFRWSEAGDAARPLRHVALFGLPSPIAAFGVSPSPRWEWEPVRGGFTVRAFAGGRCSFDTLLALAKRSSARLLLDPSSAIWLRHEPALYEADACRSVRSNPRRHPDERQDPEPWRLTPDILGPDFRQDDGFGWLVTRSPALTRPPRSGRCRALRRTGTPGVRSGARHSPRTLRASAASRTACPR